jgi:hypothetical protein
MANEELQEAGNAGFIKIRQTVKYFRLDKP